MLIMMSANSLGPINRLGVSAKSPLEVKEFVDTETEEDQRGSGPHPRHHGTLDRKTGTLHRKTSGYRGRRIGGGSVSWILQAYHHRR